MLNTKKTEIMSTSPVKSWLIDGGEEIEMVTDFVFRGSKMTPNGDCIPEIKRHLILGDDR